MNRGLTLQEDRSAVNSETSVISSPLPTCKDAPIGEETGSQTHIHTLRAGARSLQHVSALKAVPGRKLPRSPYQGAGGRSGARCRTGFGWNRSRS